VCVRGGGGGGGGGFEKKNKRINEDPYSIINRPRINNAYRNSSSSVFLLCLFCCCILFVCCHLKFIMAIDVVYIDKRTFADKQYFGFQLYLKYILFQIIFKIPDIGSVNSATIDCFCIVNLFFVTRSH